MSDLTARESSRPGWDGVVVDLVEDGGMVGYAYEDDGVVYVEVLPDEDGDPWAFEVADLQRALDIAVAMLAPDMADLPAPAPGAPDPLDVIASEFDSTALRRGPDDEGFYPVEAVVAITRRAADLGIAVASLEGFTMHEEGESGVPGCEADLAEAHRGEPWPTLVAGCAVQAEAVLEKWPRRRDFAVALEVMDNSGERFVL
jgi:hypothetical protein